MRIGIREQLAGGVLLTSLVPLAVLSIATWVNSSHFVSDVTLKSLSLAASLKAAQVAADLLLIQATCATIVTRILVQTALKDFYLGNQTTANWTSAFDDISGALASGGLSALLQVTIFSRNGTGDPNGLLNATATTVGIVLPTLYPNGSAIMLGDPGLGYPPLLYPNITYTQTSDPDPADPTANTTLVSAFADFPMNATSALLLGPLQINDSYALVSLTLPIVDNNNKNLVLGFMTVVAAASSLISVTQSREGLDKTGITLLVGPSRRENIFKYVNRPSDNDYTPPPSALDLANVKFVFPPIPVDGQTDRHDQYNDNLTLYGSSNFSMYRYEAVVTAFSSQNKAINNASSILSTKNENNYTVAVGYARPQSNLVSWLLIVEQTHSEAWGPIRRLKKIVLACVLATLGLVLIVVIPYAHYSVGPIRRLRDATKQSITPPGYSPNGSLRSEGLDDLGVESGGEENATRLSQHTNSHNSQNSGLWVRLRNLRRGGRRRSRAERNDDRRRRVFRIPAKVHTRKHCIQDEISELTEVYNDMTDELLLQYSSLEEKVAERTSELEISKKAAEAANESKTLFIANISHELKTPLNGILGMCAVCMGEDDLPRIKRSLQVVYKSGDLLLHLLNDLLTFSKNQNRAAVKLRGERISLGRHQEPDHGKIQILRNGVVINAKATKTIFDKQVREGRIKFDVKFIASDAETNPETLQQNGPHALGPNGKGRLKDMCLWGDQHRILQVIINLVSNSLKFTPEGGKVEVRIKCLGEAQLHSDESRNSTGSKYSSQRTSRNRHRHGSGSNISQVSRKPSGAKNTQIPAGTALLINPMDPNATPRVQIRERSPTPPPANARTLIFQFEVEDTGPGIPEHLRERVFEPFVQGDLGLTKKYGGTGLGLSICSQLASMMGGQITLISDEGVGSTFNMTIPLKYVRDRVPSTSSSEIPRSRPASIYNGPPPDTTRIAGDASPGGSFQKDPQPRLVGLSQPFFASAPTPSPTKDSKDQLTILDTVAAETDIGQKLRVLVAEDNLVNQEVVLRMLKLEDVYDVVVAKDGQEAYDMVKESMDTGNYFNLIFMDIQMPNLDGLQSTRLIRQMGFSAPIVALTAFSEESNVKECYDSGMNMFLSKPIRRPALKQVLQKFSTIPEEAETCSITHRSTPDMVNLELLDTPDSPITPLTNGTFHT